MLWEGQFKAPYVVGKTVRYQRLWERPLKVPEVVGKTV